MSLDHVPLTYADPFLGRELRGKYLVRRELARGGMGVVYVATHREFEMDVAVKVMAAAYAADPVMRRRFTGEARAAARIRHPNVVRVLDFGETSGGELFLVMELLRGRSLAAIIEEEAPLPVHRAVLLVSQLLSGLSQVHESGLVHGYVKPENLVVERAREGQERLKLLDFGLARDVEAPQPPSSGTAGTPSYMSPEQALGVSLDARSDLYAACVVLYELLTRERLFPDCGEKAEQLEAHVHLSPPRLALHAARFGPALTALLERGLAKTPSARFGSAVELADALLEVCPLVARDASSVPRSVVTPPALRLPVPPTPEPRSGAWLVVGGPGSGKTAYARAFASRMTGQRRVLHAEAASAAFPQPLGVVRDLVVAALGASDAREALAAVACEPVLDRLGLQALLGAAEAQAVDYRVRRREALSAFVALVHRRAADVVVDDAHALDLGSWVMLRALSTDPRGGRVVLTSRTPIEGFDVRVDLSRRPATGPGSAHVSRSAERRRLSASATMLYELLCVSGRPLAREDATRITGPAGEHRVLAELGDLIELTRHGSAVRLRSPSARSDGYQGLSPERRRAAHEWLFHAARRAGDDVSAAAHALSCLGPDETERASDPVPVEDAVEALMRGGDELRVWFDDHSAARAYRAALDVARNVESPSLRLQDLRALTGERLARVLRYLGDYVSAEVLLRESTSLATEPRTRLSTHRGLARLAASLGESARAVEESRVATMIALQIGDPGDIVKAYADLADAHRASGDGSEATLVLREGLAFAGAAAPERRPIGLPLAARLARFAAEAGAKTEALGWLDAILAGCASAQLPVAAEWLCHAADVASLADASSCAAVCSAARDACLALGDRLGAVRVLEIMIARERSATTRRDLVAARSELAGTIVSMPPPPLPADTISSDTPSDA